MVKTNQKVKENVNHHSENPKIKKIVDEDVAKTLNSGFRAQFFTRRFKRRFQRFIQKRKFLKAKQEIRKFQKFAMIYSVGTPALPISTDQGFVQLFMMMVGQAWDLFVKIGGLILKVLKTYATSLMKLLMRHPYFSMFTVFASCSLLLLNHLARKFGKKLVWYHRLLSVFISLLLIWLLSILIKAETFKTILEWLKSIFVQITITLRSLAMSLDSSLPDAVDNPKSSKAKDFQVFVFFSALTVLTTRYFLYRFKRQVVGDGPLTNEVINFIEIDLSDFNVSRNSS